MKTFSIFFLFTQIIFSQKNDVNKLLKDGEKAFLENNFISAKEIYTNVIKLDPKNKDGWYNLAVSELNIGESEIACEHFYKVYLLNDVKVVEDIKKYCPNFRNGTIMSVNDVEEKPKFIFEGKKYPLFVNNLLNPFYLKILIKELKKSRVLKDKVKGKVMIQINVNSYGVFDGKIIKVGAEEKDVEIVKMEIMRIFKNTVIYKPARNNGVSVDVWEKPTLPMDFGN